MMTSFRQRREHSGFSLVELMVAITIGLIILAALATIFVNSRKTYNDQNRAARVQENGRFAMYYLLRDLRMTGYAGCMKDPTGGEQPNASDPSLIGHLKNNLDTTSGLFYSGTSLATPIEGIEDASTSSTPAWSPSNSTSLPTSALTGSNATATKPDLLLIRLADSSTVSNLTAAAISNPTIDVSTRPMPFNKGDVVMISDCDKADLFRISDISGGQLTNGTSCSSLTPNTPCNATAQFSKQYDTAARVFRYVTRRYYIRPNANGNPSLYMDSNGGTAVELVEGIESLQVLYGVRDLSSGATPPPIQYKKASAMSASDWPNVISVKIGILARTPDNKDADRLSDKTYDVNGTTLGPFDDRFSRRVFTATVLLKNRV